jgi:hypothetical protein
MESLKRADHSEALGIDGRMILTLILKKYRVRGCGMDLPDSE